MQLNETNLKHTPMNKIFLSLFLMPFMFQAQNVLVPDSTGVVKSIDTLSTSVKVVSQDSIKPFQRYKAEGISAVVGEYIILDSDIDKGYLEMQSQGISVEGVSRCELLGKLMEDKLYAHQAKQDSLMVSDAEIDSRTDQQLQYMASELGSEEKVAQYYRKDNIADLRKELYDANKINTLATKMQQ